MPQKSKLTVYLESGQCCLVIPTDWARHVVDSYKAMAREVRSNDSANAFMEFVGLLEEQIEDTAVEIYE